MTTFVIIGAGNIAEAVIAHGHRVVLANSRGPAARVAKAFYDELGYDTVALQPLSESWRIERDPAGLLPPLDRTRLAAALARRTKDTTPAWRH